MTFAYLCTKDEIIIKIYCFEKIPIHASFKATIEKFKNKAEKNQAGLILEYPRNSRKNKSGLYANHFRIKDGKLDQLHLKDSIFFLWVRAILY